MSTNIRNDKKQNSEGLKLIETKRNKYGLHEKRNSEDKRHKGTKMEVNGICRKKKSEVISRIGRFGAESGNEKIRIVRF